MTVSRLIDGDHRGDVKAFSLVVQWTSGTARKLLESFVIGWRKCRGGGLDELHQPREPFAHVRHSISHNHSANPFASTYQDHKTVFT